MAAERSLVADRAEDGWRALDRELALWAAAGQRPSFWWRDDDVEIPSADLDRLIALSARFDLPLHLAAVPRGVGAPLAQRLAAAPLVYVMQHGFAHVNHEPAGARASEIGAHRPLADQQGDLRAGWRLLQRADLPRLLPVIVPPWNRIAHSTLPALPGLGFQMLSAFDPRPALRPVQGLLQVNCHVDPVRWKEGAAFRGADKTLTQVVDHLAARRRGRVDREEPTGLLTHHLQTDEPTWDFIEALLERLAAGDAPARWIPLTEVLAEARAHG